MAGCRTSKKLLTGAHTLYCSRNLGVPCESEVAIIIGETSVVVYFGVHNYDKT
jgi:hypothetical protein